MRAFARTTIILPRQIEIHQLRFWLRKVWALLWLTRFIPSSAASLAFVAGLRLSKNLQGAEAIAAGVVSTFLVTTGCSAWNDYCDQKEDAINVPYRPLPSGVLSARVAVSYASIAFTLAVLVSSSMGLKWLIFFSAATLASLAYSPFIKRIPGVKNSFVALFCGSLILFGGYVGGNITAAIEAATIVITSVTGREVLIDIHDMNGDELVGYKTLPIVFGTPACRLIVATLLGLTALLQLRFLVGAGYSLLSSVALLASVLCFLGVAVAVAIWPRSSNATLLVLIRLSMVGILLGILSAVF